MSGSLEGAGGIGGLLERADGYNSTNGIWTNHNYYHGDGNGNITCLESNVTQTVAASYRYDAFGNTLASSGTLANSNTYRFSSKEFIPTAGLYYYLYRFYDPVLQRWPNRDPFLESGFEVARNTLSIPSLSLMGRGELFEGPNLYQFNRNNPESEFDPLGLYSWGPGYGTPGLPNGICGPTPPCSKKQCKLVCKGMFGGAAILCGFLPPGGRQACQAAALGLGLACDSTCDSCTLP